MTRVYDAENKITSETTYNSAVAGSYSYDADGHRVKRFVGGVETWQVYGIGGELLAEYAANATASNPQKEYGYRNGELLITATVTTGSGGSAFSFTDDPVVAETTTVKAVHVTELRTAVNQARARASLSSATWTDDPVQATVTAIKAVHITELRARLDEARAALGLSAANYTDPTLISGYQIKAAHVQELRTKTNEALTTGAGTSLDLRWLVSDHLGTPRMIFDQTGSLANVSRHDYLPFGEELFAGAGGRTTAQGYSQPDNIRQKFTGYEADAETGLNFAQARYQSTTQGRFTSADGYNIFFEMNAGKDADERDWMRRAYIWEPQNWNRYAYCINNPINLSDPSGLIWVRDTEKNLYIFVKDEDYIEGNQYYDNQDRYTAVTEGPDGVRFVLGELTGSANTAENRALIGQEVYLGADGRIHPTATTTLNEQIGLGYGSVGMISDSHG